jgi:hypothetical protein
MAFGSEKELESRTTAHTKTESAENYLSLLVIPI